MPSPIEPRITLRPATAADIPILERWDREPHVIAATARDPGCAREFSGETDQPDAADPGYWPYEFSLIAPDYRYYIGECDGRPIGAMQIIDPHTESTHYWGEIEPNLRAIDIWIGAASDLGRGYGEAMMRRAFVLCFSETDHGQPVKAIVIDPLASNVRAIKFYQRLGFVPEGRRTFGDDDCLVHRLTREGWRARFQLD